MKDSSGYFVSDEGKVFKTDGKNNGQMKEIKSFIQGSGYKQMFIKNENGYKAKTVHRLVAEAFIPNPDNKPEVNHKDGDKLNNEASNLEWVTRSENIRHRFYVLYKDRLEATKRRKEEAKEKTRQRHEVICKETGMKFANQTKAAEYFGVTKMCISKHLMNNRPLLKKYHLFHTFFTE